jgi:hypothetical protein
MKEEEGLTCIAHVVFDPGVFSNIVNQSGILFRKTDVVAVINNVPVMTK